MMDVNYYERYDEYDIPIGQRNVDKFVESLIYFFDTGNTCLESRANSDVRGHRGGWVFDEHGNQVYRVLTIEPDKEGIVEDYVLMIMQRNADSYRLKVLPNQYFLHKFSEEIMERVIRENKLYIN